MSCLYTMPHAMNHSQKVKLGGKNNLLKDIAVLPQSRYSFSFAQSLRAFLFPKSAATRIAVVAISFFKWKRNSIKPLLAHRMNVVVSFARRDKCKLVGGDGMAGRFSMPVMSCRGFFHGIFGKAMAVTYINYLPFPATRTDRFVNIKHNCELRRLLWLPRNTLAN